MFLSKARVLLERLWASFLKKKQSEKLYKISLDKESHDEIERKIYQLKQLSSNKHVKDGVFEVRRSRFFEYFGNLETTLSELVNLERRLCGVEEKTIRATDEEAPLQRLFIFRLEIAYEQIYKTLSAFSSLLDLLVPHIQGQEIPCSSVEKFINYTEDKLQIGHPEITDLLKKGRKYRSKIVIHPGRNNYYWMTYKGPGGVCWGIYYISGEDNVLDVQNLVKYGYILDDDAHSYSNFEDVPPVEENGHFLVILDGEQLSRAYKWFTVPHHMKAASFLVVFCNLVLDHYISHLKQQHEDTSN